MNVMPRSAEELQAMRASKARSSAVDDLKRAALSLTAAIAADRSKPRITVLVGIRDELSRLAARLKATT